MEKGKRLKIVNGEMSLPEVMIQHIQSFLNCKDAARTTILSKSWYNAWLTRPTLHFDQRLVKKTSYIENTMRRYKHLNRKIESFTLRTHCILGTELLVNRWVVDAIEMGATDLNLQWRSSKFLLPPEVLGSENLLRLSVSGLGIDGKANCGRLKSLVLQGVRVGSDDMFRNLICCCKSIEEISISDCCMMNYGYLMLSGANLGALPKLRRLFLERVGVDALFFSDLDSRFPCLTDLSIVLCHGYRRIQICSTCLERISLMQLKQVTAKFDVPNIKKLSYSGMDIPSLRIRTAASREWESYLSFTWHSQSKTSSRFLRLKKLLTKLSRSTISLYINPRPSYFKIVDEERDFIVENLRIERCTCPDPLVRLLGVFRPKFITHGWDPAGRKHKYDHSTLDCLCEILMHQPIRPNCFIPDPDMSGVFGLKEVNVELYQEIHTDWQPLPPVYNWYQRQVISETAVNNPMIRFKLKWGTSEAGAFI